MKNKFLLFLTGLFAVAAMFGTTYSAWTFTNNTNITNNVQVEVPSWDFLADSDFAVYDNIRSVTNLVASKEESITQNSNEAIRFTSTSGTSTKDHIININLDRDYYLSEIKYFKLEFDLYRKHRREQYNKGIPKVQFTINNSTLGSDQGGVDYPTAISPFVVTEIDDDWWHLEYYVFAHMPTLARHSDTPIALTKKINGIRINDRYMYDFGGITAFSIIDNLKFSAEPTSRLGIFNRWTSDTAGKWFWFKVAFSGELHSVKLYSSDTSIAVPEFDPADTESTCAPFSNGSPFYFRLLAPGTVRFTAVLEVGDNHEIFTITSDNFTVNAAS